MSGAISAAILVLLLSSLLLSFLLVALPDLHKVLVDFVVEAL